MRSQLLAAAGALCISFAVPAGAAPLVDAGVKAIATETSPVDSVAYRRCWWRHGYRHCRYVDRYYRSYGYAPYYYDDGYYGYGYGPSIGLSFGGWGGGHHGHFGGHRR